MAEIKAASSKGMISKIRSATLTLRDDSRRIAGSQRPQREFDPALYQSTARVDDP